MTDATGTLTAQLPRPSTWKRMQPWVVCLTAALFFFYEFIQLNMFNAISSELMRDFSINATQLGNLSAMYLYADVLFLFPAGIILDRLSTRTVILSAMAVCVASTFLFATTHSLPLASFYHFLAGIGNAFCFLSCIKLASRWFTSRHLALITGLIVTMAMLGGMIAQTPLALLTHAYGWRESLMIDAGLGAVIFALIWFIVHDQPANHKTATVEEQAQSIPMSVAIRRALTTAQNWLCGLYTSLVNLPIMLLGALWGGLYLERVHHLTKTQATYATSMIFLGTIIGSPLVGWLSDRIRRRQLPMIVGGLLSIATIAVIMYWPHLSLSAVIALFFVLGLVTSTQVIAYPMITESSPKAMTGTAMGLASVIIMGGGALSQPLFGWIMDKVWDGTMENGVRAYSAHSLQSAMWLIPAGFMIATVAILLAKETFCKPVDSQ